LNLRTEPEQSLDDGLTNRRGEAARNVAPRAKSHRTPRLTRRLTAPDSALWSMEVLTVPRTEFLIRING